MIANEVAENEFKRFVELMDLDIDVNTMDDEDKQNFEPLKKRIVNAIMNGSLTINDNGEPTYTPRRSKDAEPITFYEPTGASLMAMDRRKKNEDVGKMYAIMGDITKTHSNVFAKMKMADLKVCQSLVTLFLG